MATDYHAEHVGSLLRQPWLLEARAAYKRGTLTEAELREVEDRAVLENITLQRDAGIRLFTDGEARRTNWMTGILESTGGMSLIATPMVTWRREDGEEPSADETDFEMMAATAKVYRKNPLTNVEAEFMAREVPGQFKITMMSAAMGGMVWRPSASSGRWPWTASCIDEAARYVPMQNLAISPQCGFASTSQGNVLTVDDEKRKLELVADTARKVWG